MGDFVTRTDAPWTHTVPPSGSTEDFFNAVAYQKGWYDFTIGTDADPGWTRRHSGHLETGTDSFSG
ncbi:phospholipase domain-containing protein [Streptomyces violascens]|uniref:phospholipase domain-containing protein n=1 Tax=Streptomyces violascens TaxID=67381 RepID=UPI00365027B1